MSHSALHSPGQLCSSRSIRGITAPPRNRRFDERSTGSPSPAVVSVLTPPLADKSPVAPETQTDANPAEARAAPSEPTPLGLLPQALELCNCLCCRGCGDCPIRVRSNVVPGLSSHQQPPASDLQIAPTPAVSEIWKGIFEPDVKTVIAFTSPRFLRVGSTQAYLLYYGPLSAPEGTAMVAAEHDPYVDKQFLQKGQKLYFSNGWSGTGEVLAVNRLTGLAAQFRQVPNVIPSRALTLNEARASNVVFIGAPFMNGMIAKIGTESAPIYITAAEPDPASPPCRRGARDLRKHPGSSDSPDQDVLCTLQCYAWRGRQPQDCDFSRDRQLGDLGGDRISYQIEWCLAARQRFEDSRPRQDTRLLSGRGPI